MDADLGRGNLASNKVGGGTANQDLSGGLASDSREGGSEAQSEALFAGGWNLL